jgi:hypothetical protein
LITISNKTGADHELIIEPFARLNIIPPERTLEIELDPDEGEEIEITLESGQSEIWIFSRNRATLR